MPGILGGTATRQQWAAVGWRCSEAGAAVEGAVRAGGVLRAGLGVVSADAQPPLGLWGRMAAQMSWARAVGAAGGAGPCGGSGEGVRVVCGTITLVGMEARAGGSSRFVGGTCGGVARVQCAAWGGWPVSSCCAGAFW